MSEQSYLDLLTDVMKNGISRPDRTGTGTRSVFGRQIRFDLSRGFPLLTTKKVFLRGIIEELLWFLKGSTNARELEDKKVNIWAGWGDPQTRELGPVYGKQWRKWESPEWNDPARVVAIDQITDLIDRLKSDPYSRRHLVVAWNPGEIAHMALPPCHCLFQFYVEPLTAAEIHRVYYARSDSNLVNHIIDKNYYAPTIDDLIGLGLPTQKLSCQLYQRSGDIFLGVPFNIASYALLTQMVAQQVNMVPGDFVHSFGDLHLYDNHVEQAEEQLSRKPYQFPLMEITKARDIFSYEIEDFKLIGYQSHPTIKAPVAI